jgi:hypothetical protein
MSEFCYCKKNKMPKFYGCKFMHYKNIYAVQILCLKIYVLQKKYNKFTTSKFCGCKFWHCKKNIKFTGCFNIFEYVRSAWIFLSRRAF